MPSARQRPRFALPGLGSLAAVTLSAAACVSVVPLASPAAAGPTNHVFNTPLNTALNAAVKSTDDAAATATPLRVEIDLISPAEMPKRGPITVIGTLTNADTEPWRDITLYPFIGNAPITTEAELDAAMLLPEDADVGSRILEPADYTRVASLEPGQSVSFRIQVPRQHLNDRGVGQPGVYWFGVHALGSGPAGMDNRADGRARTFVTLLSKNASSVSTSVIVPIRGAVSYAPDGSIDGLKRWATLLRPEGRLARLAELAVTDGGQKLSWLVDPAVLAAVEKLAQGNPARPLESSLPPEPDEPSQPTEPAGPVTSPESGATGSPGDAENSDAAAVNQQAAFRTADEPSADELAALQTEVTTLAATWWEAIVPALSGADVLALPYGDLNLAGAAAHHPDAYDMARSMSSSAFEGWGIATSPINAPVSGTLNGATLSLLATKDPTTPVLVADSALPAGLNTSIARVAGLELIAVDSGASAGGPGPTDPLRSTAVRQRTLAEAGIRSLNATGGPLVVQLPSGWSSADNLGLARDLEQSWMDLSPLASARKNQASTSLNLSELNLTLLKPIGSRVFTAASALIATGGTLQRVLNGNDQVATAAQAEALSALSYHRGRSASERTEASSTQIRSLLDQVQIQVPRSVTLSGSSGRFAATVSNDLSQPITVGLAPMADAGITLSTPDPVDIAPGSSATFLIQASGVAVGVHDVRMSLTDATGTTFGTIVAVPVRASQVSKIIWVFLAVGGGLLFGTIGSRLVRRIRKSRRTGN